MSGVVGRSVVRSDSFRKVTGSGRYTVDLAFPGMVYGKLLRSPHAHARIVSIDTHEALKLPGVLAVITGEAHGFERLWGGHIMDQPVLPWDIVRFRGEPVAAVAAESEDIAEEACRLIEVRYETLPSIFDPQQAAEPGAQLLHPYMMDYERNPPVCRPIPGTNIVNHTSIRRGSIKEAFRDAAVVLESTYTNAGQEHVTLEPTASIASWERDGRLTIWTSTQCPFVVRDQVARSVGMAPSRVRIIVPDVGGGFGGKGNMRLEAYAALLSRASHRPVKMVHTRYEEFVGSTMGHPAKIVIKAAADSDGALRAMKIRAYYDTGAYGDSGEMVSWQGALGGAGPYHVPCVEIDSYAVYTNKVPAGAFRGMGWPQMLWAVESHIDMLSKELGMDPVAFRLKNLLKDGDVTVTGEELVSVGLEECLLKTAEAIGWGQSLPENHGRGIALVMKSSVNNSTASAVIKVNEDGGTQIVIGAPEVGQGSHSAMTQIAAEVLGVSLDTVEVTPPDTAYSPYDRGAVSDRTTFHLGDAVYVAAMEARRQLLDVAADFLEARADDLDIENGSVFVRGVPSKALAVRDVARRAYRFKGGPVIAQGRHIEEGVMPLAPITGRSAKAVSHYKFGAQAVELEVNPDTGMVKIARIVSAHDCGRAVNPMQVEGQIEGAVAQGVGFALFEEMQFDEGQVMNPSLMEYSVPTAPDVPPIVSIIVECPHPYSPFGVKGVGEPGIIGVAPAIGNAIFNALGVRLTELPMTPERVLRGIQLGRSDSDT